MEKEIFSTSKSSKVAAVRNDDLIFNGKDILIPSYYAPLVLDYISETSTEAWNEADREDFDQFKKFFKDVISFKERKVNRMKKL